MSLHILNVHTVMVHVECNHMQTLASDLYQFGIVKLKRVSHVVVTMLEFVYVYVDYCHSILMGS